MQKGKSDYPTSHESLGVLGSEAQRSKSSMLARSSFFPPTLHPWLSIIGLSMEDVSKNRRRIPACSASRSVVVVSLLMSLLIRRIEVVCPGSPSCSICLDLGFLHMRCEMSSVSSQLRNRSSLPQVNGSRLEKAMG